MKQTITIFFLFIVFCSFSQEKMKETKCPFEIILLAIEHDSIELLKTAYSKRIVNEELKNIKWGKALKVWKKLLKEDFGKFSLIDFSCKIDSEKSKIIISYRGKEYGKMDAVKENGNWKFDER